MMARTVSRGAGAKRGQDVLGVDYADDLVERFGVHGVARAARHGDLVGRVLDGHVRLEGDHLGARGHHLLRGLLAELEDALEQPGVLLQHAAAFGALLDEHPDLLGRVQPLVLAGGRDAHAPEEPVGGAVEERDRPRHDPGEAHQRRGHPAAHRLGIEQRQRLRHQLAEDDVQHGDDDERDRRRYAVRGERGERVRQPVEGALDQAGERRLADPAEAQRGERDPELRGGDVAVERLYGASCQPSFAIPRAGELVEPRAPRADQGELGRHEEGVREDQDDDRDKTEAYWRRSRFHTV